MVTAILRLVTVGDHLVVMVTAVVMVMVAMVMVAMDNGQRGGDEALVGVESPSLSRVARSFVSSTLTGEKKK